MDKNIIIRSGFIFISIAIGNIAHNIVLSFIPGHVWCARIVGMVLAGACGAFLYWITNRHD